MPKVKLYLFLQTFPQRRAVPSGRVLPSEDFMSQIKVKEEKVAKEMREKEDRKRKKEQVSKKSDRNVKKAKVNNWTHNYQYKHLMIATN